jgi:hypothetical protein
MPWFKVDDGFAFHSKTLQAGNAAVGMWVRAGSWASQNLTDGEISSTVARQLGTRGQAQKLVDAGLWVPTDNGFAFHEWEGRNPTREQVEQRRRQTADRLRRWREKGGEAG